MIFANAPPSEGLFFGKSLEVQTFPVSFDRKYAEPRECSQKITDTQIITGNRKGAFNTVITFEVKLYYIYGRSPDYI